jgi:hypothetical protein
LCAFLVHRRLSFFFFSGLSSHPNFRLWVLLPLCFLAGRAAALTAMDPATSLQFAPPSWNQVRVPGLLRVLKKFAFVALQ